MANLDNVNDDIMESLTRIHGTGDTIVIKRLLSILEYCTTDELTVEDLAEKFGMHYQTIYGNVRSLVQAGLLEIAPRRLGRKNLYRTKWETVPEDQRGLELRWKSGEGVYSPISDYIERFITVGPRRFAYEIEVFGKCLISNHVNKKLDALGEKSYGKEHEEALFVRLNASIEFLENIIGVMRQAINSPILHEDAGWEMYKLPESLSPEEISAIHDELEMYFQQEGYYDNSED